MIVWVTEAGETGLRELGDCTSFAVRTPPATPVAAVGRTLEAAGWGGVDGEHAWIRSDAISRAAAEAGVDDGWQVSFEAMLGYAKTKGWWREKDRAIRAHIASG